MYFIIYKKSVNIFSEVFMKQKTLYVSDLDDTLVDEKNMPSNELLKKLDNILNYANFSIASARSYDSIYSRFSCMKNRFKIISRCGTIIYDEKGIIIHFEKLNYDYLKIIDFSVRNNLCPVFVTVEENAEHFYYNEKYINDEAKKRVVGMKISNASNEKIANLNNIVGVYCFGNTEDIDTNLENINIRKYSTFIHFSSINATKGKACLWLKEKYNYDSLISFGNDSNDYDMLDVSDLGYLIFKDKSQIKDKYENIKFDNGKSIIQIIEKGESVKILMIPSGYYPECCGGVEVITQSLSEGLIKRGFEVVVMCQSNKNEDTYINGVHVYRLKPKDINNINNNRFIYKINRILQMYNPFNKKMMRKIIKKENPNIIHLHMARTLSMSILTVANELKIPVISTLHEYFSLWNFDPFAKMSKMLETKPQWYVELIRKTHRKLTKKVKYVTAPLEKTISEYQKEGYYKSVQGEEVLNALPMYSKLKRSIILDEKISRIKENTKTTFLIISRLMPFKGIELAIESFMKIDNKDIVLNVVGDGELSNYVKDCAKKDNRIKYHGYLVGKKKNDIFRNSDVLIFPTTELETYGLVILEAYNYSMPVITSDVSATRRLVENEKTGRVIKNITSEKLSKAIIEYTNKQELLEEMNNCFNKIDKKDYEIFIDKYIEIYEKVLGGY